MCCTFKLSQPARADLGEVHWVHVHPPRLPKKNVLVEKHKNCIKLDFYLPDHLQIYHTTALTLLKACIIHCLTNKDWASCAFPSDICTPSQNPRSALGLHNFYIQFCLYSKDSDLLVEIVVF